VHHRIWRWGLVLLGASLIFFSIVYAQGGFTLSRGTIAGGGTLSSGGFTLVAEIGQPVVGEPLHSGSFSLTSGSVAGLRIVNIYLPVIHATR